jgi:2-isopropylmalate synthase
LENLFYEINKDQIDIIYEQFLKIADVKKEINDQDLRVLMNNFAYDRKN